MILGTDVFKPINPVAFSLFGINIHWYGIIIAFGLAAGVILGIREAKRRGYKSDMILDLMLIAIPLCIVGARVYYVIPELEHYSGDILRIFAVWEGGLAIYGAVIGGVIAAFIFSRWRKISFGELLDIGAPSLIIGQAIGRWGNFVNQEAFGNLVTDPSLHWFPYSVPIPAKTIGDTTYIAGYYQATFFYESMWNLLVFAALMLLRKKIKVRGGVFALYVVLYGFGRFFIEYLRSDSLMAAGNIKISMLLSAVLFVCGIAYLIIMSKKQKPIAAYDGIYSLSWTNEQLDEYRKSRKSKKSVKAEEEKPETTEEKPEADEEKQVNKKPAKKKEKKPEIKKDEPAANKKPVKKKEEKTAEEEKKETTKKQNRKTNDSGSGEKS